MLIQSKNTLFGKFAVAACWHFHLLMNRPKTVSIKIDSSNIVRFHIKHRTTTKQERFDIDLAISLFDCKLSAVWWFICPTLKKTVITIIWTRKHVEVNVYYILPRFNWVICLYNHNDSGLLRNFICFLLSFLVCCCFLSFTIFFFLSQISPMAMLCSLESNIIFGHTHASTHTLTHAHKIYFVHYMLTVVIYFTFMSVIYSFILLFVCLCVCVRLFVSCSFYPLCILYAAIDFYDSIEIRRAIRAY